MSPVHVMAKRAGSRAGRHRPASSPIARAAAVVAAVVAALVRVMPGAAAADVPSALRGNYLLDQDSQYTRHCWSVDLGATSSDTVVVVDHLYSLGAITDRMYTLTVSAAGAVSGGVFDGYTALTGTSIARDVFAGGVRNVTNGDVPSSFCVLVSAGAAAGTLSWHLVVDGGCPSGNAAAALQPLLLGAPGGTTCPQPRADPRVGCAAQGLSPTWTYYKQFYGVGMGWMCWNAVWDPPLSDNEETLLGFHPGDCKSQGYETPGYSQIGLPNVTTEWWDWRADATICTYYDLWLPGAIPPMMTSDISAAVSMDGASVHLSWQQAWAYGAPITGWRVQAKPDEGLLGSLVHSWETVIADTGASDPAATVSVSALQQLFPHGGRIKFNVAGINEAGTALAASSNAVDVPAAGAGSGASSGAGDGGHAGSGSGSHGGSGSAGGGHERGRVPTPPLPLAGSGAPHDPYVLTPGFVPDLYIGRLDTLYFIYSTAGFDKARVIVEPCWGRFDYLLGINQVPMFLDDGSPMYYNDNQMWPDAAHEGHGTHVWEEHDVQVVPASNGFLMLVVRNTFVLPDEHASHDNPPGDAFSNFTLSVAMGSGFGNDRPVLFTAPGDAEITVTATTIDSISLAWQSSGEDTDEYQVFWHMGVNGDGTMEPGMVMGTFCGVTTIGRFHMHGGHGVVELFDAWQAGITSATITGLMPDTEYHVEVTSRRADESRAAGYAHASYHQTIVHTDAPSDGVGAVRPARLGALAAVATLSCVLLSVSKH